MAWSKEKKNAYAKKHRADNPEMYRKYGPKHYQRKKEWIAANPEVHAANKRRQYLRQRYGLSAEQVDEMLAAQGFRCAVCPSANPRHIDHCHATGAVRGILCMPRNIALGHTKDNPGVLRALAEYLERKTPLILS